MAASRPSTSENILSEQTDVCVANAIVKTGIGFGAGVVLSAILFQRKCIVSYCAVTSHFLLISLHMLAS
ncbi:uncharacterized protein MELLADRAFT_86329 [Melampsora larici-populina 98AG31]|uniref:MICOS complex subunit MIC10 n=1 Tax=Melampsora larici-populina (strain 98AG31 / pathotype 3-4-7) TaxID=747676 RepID=F4RLD2_MELLP|nr:uncharacterized protein MELLADRAFT_86329 [Melampsora larici-populina 98AG31]EGG06887.1 hypothetical protein MELLADRAFT_86329 [Melampsora larici-populina 98AG31]